MYCFHSNIGDVSPASYTGGEIDKKISTYVYSSRRIAMWLSLMWLLIKKIVRPSDSKAGLFMCR
jgi:hypothetical protein